MPPVNVVVAGLPKVAAPVVPLKARAATVDVAELDDVATYKALDIDRRVHWSEVREASDSASCAAVELAIVSIRFGVVVPIPILPLALMVILSPSRVLNLIFPSCAPVVPTLPA